VRFLSPSESEQWLRDRNRQKPNVVAGANRAHFAYPQAPGRIRFLSHWIATSLTHEMSALLWITEWGIWPSSENWHLYYKLRQSYADQRLLEQAPGHLFLKHEMEDLASFLQLAMLNGWGGYVLTEADYVNIFFSHDEYFDFFAADERNLEDVRQIFGGDRQSSSG
jgi:hypothetical protein